MAIKTILVSQPKPESDRSPYFSLAQRQGLTIDFRPFIKVEGVSPKEFREQRVNLADFTGILLTSKVAADHFFRMAEATRFEVPDSMKYFFIGRERAFINSIVIHRFKNQGCIKA